MQKPLSLPSAFTWNAASQATKALVMLLVVPVAVHRVGIASYGVYTLAMLALNVLTQLDGGMGSTTTRFLAIAEGSGSRIGTSQLLCTLGAFVFVLGLSGGLIVFVTAAPLTTVFQIPSSMRHEATTAFRLIALLLPLGLLSGVPQGLFQARGDFATVARLTIVTQLGWAIAVYALVGREHGVETMLELSCASQLVVLIGLSIGARRDLVARAGFIPRDSVRPLVAFAARVQLFSLTTIVNLQLDGFVVGVLLPVRQVAIYGTGALVATQLWAFPQNALSPVVARLGRSFGERGYDSAFAEYVELQRKWVVLCGAWVAIAAGMVTFQIEAWLGPAFTRSAWVALILLLGFSVNLLTGPLNMFLRAAGRPEVEFVYGLVATVINVAITLALAWLGLFGIVAGTSLGLTLGSLYLLRAARHRVSDAVPSFVRGIPVIACVLSGGVAAACAYGLYQFVGVRGMLGMAAVSLAFLPGALTFLIATFGPVETLARVRSIGGLRLRVAAQDERRRG